MYTGIGRSLGTDYFRIADQLTGEELSYLRRTRDFVDNDVLPVINGYWERAEFPWPLIEKLAKLGVVGDGIDGYGCPPMSPIATGLVHMELNRGDGSLGTFLGVQAGLAMQSIAMLGSEHQKQRWLPGMAALEKLGAFALTEPMHGSDSVALETSARRDGGDWVIDGAKKWIGNGTLADVVVVWARDVTDGHVKGFLVEKGTPGFDARRMDGKGSLRAVWQAEITLSSVRVPEENRLPGANSFKDAGRVLAGTRNAVAWGALGHATAAYEAAMAYCRQRQQFGKPLMSFQIVQDRLVKMLAEICSMQLYCLRLGLAHRRGQADRHHRRDRQDEQHPQGPAGHRRGTGPARRQRHLAGLPRDAAPGRHRGDPHLRRHRDHPDPDRRPGHHRCQRLRLTAGPSGSSTSTPTGSGCAPRSTEPADRCC